MYKNVNKTNIKVLKAIIIFSAIILIFVFSSNKSLFISGNESSQFEKDDSGLIIPTQEYVLNYGYPKNESGETYGPNMGNLLLVEPELLLALGENGVRGYIYQPKGINSPDELDDYIPPKSTPLYLQDGKTIIGTFNFN